MLGSAVPNAYGCHPGVNTALCIPPDEIDTSASDVSALTDKGFTHGGHDFRIFTIWANGSDLNFGLAGSTPIPAGFTLYVDGTAYVGTDATTTSQGAIATWSSAVDWSGGSAVRRSCTAPPSPTGVALSTDRLDTTEGSSTTFTVALTDDPGADTTVKLVRTQYFPRTYFQPEDIGEARHRWNLNAATLSPATLTFTSGSSGNYATAQTITVTGVEDADTCDEQLFILVLVQTTTGSDTESPDYTPVGGSANVVTGVFVTINDNDTGACGGL